MGLATGGVQAQDTPANTFVMPRSGPFAPEQVEIPNARAIEAWIRSGHSHASSPAFSHWNDAGEIPPVCAVCHSGQGFRSFHGLDGSDPGVPAEPVPTGGVVDCDTCHNPNLGKVTSILLPSGVDHPVTTADAACVTCHQGRAAGVSVSRATADSEPDTPSAELNFVNPHYAIAAATNLGGYGQNGFEYPGKTYTGRFLHAKPVETCVNCHSPHSLTVAAETCLTCHQTGDPRAIRISRQSYDGSGNSEQGIFVDINRNADLLMTTIRDYARDVAGTAIVYDGAHHPYFFADANGDGRADQQDGRGVAYNAWTPRLLQAAYNWKFVTADSGIHVHNPHYALELVYDSIEDLGTALGRDIAETGISR
ncbi:cytochrome C [Pseudooceanicola sp. LIPI14-2-Ac024]|uniref:cytochrome C n=1 Tax=Pseudooceanicola sp. LIPI14-2-Ac024 TaxID=3344875 RepID=UPI0035D0C52C